MAKAKTHEAVTNPIREEPDPFAGLKEQYRAAYPKNKVLYVTGDGLVFLANEQEDARQHQATIRKGPAMQTIKL